jgi:DNA-binding CsgD family transcriptional regulator
MSDSMSADPTTKLTDNQRAYLRLVLAHQTSKEIAQQFGISAHTVDKRIKEAMRILGVGTRIEAAKMLAAAQDEVVTTADAPLAPDEPVVKARSQNSGLFTLPFPTSARPENDLSILQRAGWMIGLIIGLALATGILLSGLTAISTLIVALLKT